MLQCNLHKYTLQYHSTTSVLLNDTENELKFLSVNEITLKILDFTVFFIT